MLSLRGAVSQTLLYWKEKQRSFGVWGSVIMYSFGNVWLLTFSLKISEYFDLACVFPGHKHANVEYLPQTLRNDQQTEITTVAKNAFVFGKRFFFIYFVVKFLWVCAALLGSRAAFPSIYRWNTRTLPPAADTGQLAVPKAWTENSKCKILECSLRSPTWFVEV